MPNDDKPTLKLKPAAAPAMPAKLRVTNVYGFIDDDGKRFDFVPRQIVEDSDVIARLVKRDGAPIETAE